MSARRIALSAAVPLTLTLLALGALGVLIDQQAGVALSGVAVEAVGPTTGVVLVAEVFPTDVGHSAVVDRTMARVAETLCGAGRTMLGLGALSAVLNLALLTTSWGRRMQAAGVATR